MPTNWPPAEATYPTWPPPEIGGPIDVSNIRVLLAELRALGFTQAAPTTTERNTFFKDARCDHGDAVIGRMLVSPDGLRRYPFAVCDDPAHRDLLVLWPPYYRGSQSGTE
jgi:hypothetical protein